MSKRVLNVGQCDPDHASISSFLTRHFNVEIGRTHKLDDTLEELQKQDYDLVLINRKLDIDYTDGTLILDTLKEHADYKDIPVMIVSNFADAQEAAVDQGATYGFGKAEYDQPEVVERLEKLLN